MVSFLISIPPFIQTDLVYHDYHLLILEYFERIQYALINVRYKYKYYGLVKSGATRLCSQDVPLRLPLDCRFFDCQEKMAPSREADQLCTGNVGRSELCIVVELQCIVCGMEY